LEIYCGVRIGLSREMEKGRAESPSVLGRSRKKTTEERLER
jgi:hypothetical protein